MMRVMLLLVSMAAIPALWGVAGEYAVIAAVLVMFVNFASFCLLYDKPLEWARGRIAAQLRGMDPNSDAAQVMHTRAIKTTDEDRDLGMSPLVLLNFASAGVSAVLLAWGLYLRMM